MKTKLRKRTHKFIDDSRISKVVVMPFFGTRALCGYGLPMGFPTEIDEKQNIYVKSLEEARMKAIIKQAEIEKAIINKINANITDERFKCTEYNGTWILEKVRKSSRKINLS